MTAGKNPSQKQNSLWPTPVFGNQPEGRIELDETSLNRDLKHTKRHHHSVVKLKNSHIANILPG